MSIRVFIATTNGPVEIQRITKEDPEVRSVICENGTARALPISRAYDGFVKEPTGVIQRSYEHPSYRMDLSHAITDGNSWQLGAFVAHALFDEELLATPDDQVDNVLWLTGEVDRDLNVRAVDHIQEKLDASRDFFDQLKQEDIRCFCFIPATGFMPDDTFIEELQIDGELLKLESVRDVKRICDRFALRDPLPFAEDEEEDENDEEEIDLYKADKNAPPPIKDNRLMRFIAIGTTALALLIGLYMQFEDTIIALREGSLKLGVSELRASPAQGCQKPDKFPLDQESALFPSSPVNGLCALEITLNNRGAPAYMWVFAQDVNDGHFLLADREGLLMNEPQQGLIGWRMVIPTRLNESIDYRIVALASNAPLTDSVNRMLRAQFNDPKSNWEQVKQRLVEEKITVVSALHSLIKP